MRAAWLGLGLVACTFEPGAGFATLTEVRLQAEAPDRFTTELGHDVQLEGLSLEVRPLVLQELEGGSGGFDPANPPEGFSLCHNGHCHADDGSLPTYAEIEAMLAGDSASWSTVVEIPLGSLDLLDGQPVTADVVRPSRELPAADIGHLALPVTRLVIEGTVGADRLQVDLSAECALEGGLALPVDRSTARQVAVDVDLSVEPSLLDGIDWPALAIDGIVDVVEPADPEAVALLDALCGSPLAGDAREP